MYAHDLTATTQVARDRTAAFTKEASVRSFQRRSRPDRRPPPGRHWIDRRHRQAVQLHRARTAR